jgi:hypothetical protein
LVKTAMVTGMYRRATRTFRPTGQSISGADRTLMSGARGTGPTYTYGTERLAEADAALPDQPRWRVSRGVIPLLWVAALAAAAIIHAVEIDRQARIQEPTPLELASRDVPIEAFKPAWRLAAEATTAETAPPQPVEDKRAEKQVEEETRATEQRQVEENKQAVVTAPIDAEAAAQQPPITTPKREETTVTAAVESKKEVAIERPQQEQGPAPADDPTLGPIAEADTVDRTVTGTHTPLKSVTDEPPSADPGGPLVETEKDEKGSSSLGEAAKASCSHLPESAKAEAPVEVVQTRRHLPRARARLRVRTAQLSPSGGLASKLDSRGARLFSLDLPSRYSP